MRFVLERDLVESFQESLVSRFYQVHHDYMSIGPPMYNRRMALPCHRAVLRAKSVFKQPNPG